MTALVTPALDYVGGLTLEPVDPRFGREEEVAHLGEALRSLVGSIDDASSLLFVYRVLEDNAEDVAEYETLTAAASPAELATYVRARAKWLRARKLRRCEVMLFFSHEPYVKGALARGQVGLKCMFADAGKLTAAAHRERLKSLAAFRDRLTARLARAGLKSREALPEDIQRVHYELLNPTLARALKSPGPLRIKDTLWAEPVVRRVGAHLAEYTEAESLCHEDLEDGRGSFRQGDLWRRVCTLKVLPEGGTHYFDLEPLLGLSVSGRDGEPQPFGYTVAVAVGVQPQGKARWTLSTQHGLVDALRAAVPFLTQNSVARQAADAAKQGSIRELFAELNELSSKLVTLSVSLLLDARSKEELDQRTEAARSAFNAMGNSELHVEDVAQVPAFISCLPGAGAYQLRRKACTSRNAADFLPVFAPWRGTTRAASLLETPGGEGLRFDLFDKSISNSHHGVVVGQTGAGKSMGLGALTLDAMAAGADAILVDNGESWRALTELLGGVHIPVDIRTSLSPFVAYPEMLDERGELSNESIEDVVNFLQVCVAEPGHGAGQGGGKSGFDKLTTDVVSRAVRSVYLGTYRKTPEDRPLVGAFRDALNEHPWQHPDDRAIAQGIARRLGIFCDGIYAEFLNRESKLKFDARILTFDLQRVSKSPSTYAVAMATIIQAITNRALKRNRRLLVEVDEGHEHLGDETVSGPFLAGAYRKMRKYEVSMWMISQHFTDFTRTKVGSDIVENATLKLFLRRDSGHEAVIDHFGLSPRAAQAFKSLAFRPGHYSDFFLMYGPKHAATVRLRLHPLAYWILTTDPADRALLEQARGLNPALAPLEVLQGLAGSHPHGAPRPVRARQGPKARTGAGPHRDVGLGKSGGSRGAVPGTVDGKGR